MFLLRSTYFLYKKQKEKKKKKKVRKENFL